MLSSFNRAPLAPPPTAQRNEVTVKPTKFRTLIAAGTLGVVGLTGIVAANAAGAIGTGGSTTSGAGRLTAEQKECMSLQGITKPEGRPTAEQREAIATAAANCGITLPARKGPVGRRIARLTQEQRDCLTSNGVTKPDHRLSAEERAAFKAQLQAAAQTCGIPAPTAPTN